MQPQQPRPTFPTRRSGRAMLAALVVALGAALPLASAQGGPSEAGVVVHGSGTAYGTPDLAVLTLGVTSVDPQVQTALDQADKAMAAVRNVFLDGGVAEKDIRTVAFNVWREEVRDRNGNVTGERFHVVHSYQVTVRELGSVGGLLAAAVQAGANTIQGITFGLSDRSALQAQARAEAMHDAQSRARQLASLAGVTLGPPLSIEESTSVPSSPVPMARLQAAGGPAAPVEGGQLAVTVQVTVRYALQ